MARIARFKVRGRFDGATEATVEIDRDAGMFSVRPLRRRRAYELTLTDVAESVLYRVIKAEHQQSQREKKAKRFLVRRGGL